MIPVLGHIPYNHLALVRWQAHDESPNALFAALSRRLAQCLRRARQSILEVWAFVRVLKRWQLRRIYDLDLFAHAGDDAAIGARTKDHSVWRAKYGDLAIAIAEIGRRL